MAAVVASAAGCPSKKSRQSNEPPFAGVSVQIAVPATLDLRPAWEPFASEWSRQSGAGFGFAEIHKPGFVEKPGFSGGAAGAEPSPSVLVVPVTGLAELAANDALAMVPDEFLGGEGVAWDDVFRGLRERVASLEGRPAVVPLSCPALVLYYRQDLLEAAKLKPPDTWEDYHRLLERLDKWAPGRTAVEPWGEDFRATMFLARAACYAKSRGNRSFCFDVFDQNCRPLIAEAGFVRALREALADLALMPESVRRYSPAECRREFFAGRAALAVTWEVNESDAGGPLPSANSANDGSGAEKTRAAAKNAPPQRLQTGAVGVVRLPGTAGAKAVFNHSRGLWEAVPRDHVHRVTLTAFDGWCAAVSSRGSSRERQAAWSLLPRLTGSEALSAAPRKARSLCRYSQMADPSPWIGRELSDAGAGEAYVQAVADALRDDQLLAELPILGRERFRADLTKQLETALTGGRPPEEALAEIARLWSGHIQKLGPTRVLDSYRRSLGLPPQPRGE